MTRAFVLTLLAAVCGTASAQVSTDAGFAAQLQGVRVQTAGAGKAVAQAVKASDEDSAPARLIQSVLVSMNDQPGTAEMLVGWLRGNKAVVQFSDRVQDGSVGTWLGDFTTQPQIPAVYVAAAAMKPVSYRYVAVLIARETAELMLKDYPESAEKRYIVASRMAETFFELGGTRLTMGSIDGHADPKVEAGIRLWVENDPAGGVQTLKATGHKTLKDQESALAAEYERLIKLEQAIDQMLSVPNDPNAPALRVELEETQARASAVNVKLGAVKAAQAYYENFSQDEKNYIWEHQGSLQ